MEELGEVLRELGVETLDEAAVRGVWESEFTSAEADFIDQGSVPDFFSRDSAADVLRKAAELGESLVESGSEGERSVWGPLAEAVGAEGWKGAGLVALLYVGVETGLRQGAELGDELTATAAAELYVQLLRWPGALPLRLFHVNMFQRCLDAMSRAQGRLRTADLQGKAAKKGAKARDGRAEETLDRDSLAQVREAVERLACALWALLSHDGFSLAGATETLGCVAATLSALVELDEKEQRGRSGASADSLVAPSPSMADFRRRSFKGKAYATFHALAARHEKTAWRCLQKMKGRLLLFDFGASSEKSSGVPASALRLADEALAWVQALFRAVGADEKDRKGQLQHSLLRHMEFVVEQVTDKADYRRKACDVVLELFGLLDAKRQRAFVGWLKREGTSRDANRGFVAELAGAFLNSHPDEDLASAMLTVLTRLTLDKAFTSASRSLLVIAAVFKDPAHQRLVSILRSLPHHFLSHPTASRPELNGAEDAAEDEDDEPSVPPDATAATAPNQTTAAKPKAKRVRVVPYDVMEDFVAGDEDDWTILRLLHFHSQQESAKLRQNALVLYEALAGVAFAKGARATAKACLEKLELHGRDVSVMVRKAAAEGLSRLLAESHSWPLAEEDGLHEAWLNTVLPAVMDLEESGAKKARGLVLDTLVRPISAGPEEASRLAWELLGKVEASKDLQRYLTRCLRKAQMEEDGRLGQASVSAIDDVTGDPGRSSAAWMLLANLCERFPVTGRNAWADIADYASRETGYIAKIIATKAALFAPQLRGQLAGQIEASLRAFQIPPTNFPMALVALKLLRSAEGPAGQAKFEEMGKELLGHCEGVLRRLIYGITGQHFDTGHTGQFSVADGTQHTRASQGTTATRASEAIFMPPPRISVQPPSQPLSSQGSDGTSSESGSSQPLSSQPVSSQSSLRASQGVPFSQTSVGSRWSTATGGVELTEELVGLRLFMVGELAQHCPRLVGRKLQLVVESVFAAEHIRREMTVRPPSREEAEGRAASALLSEAANAALLTHRVRSIAATSLGKMALMDETLARSVMPRFIAEMGNLSNHHTLRNNIMVVVHDICIVYTSLIDRHSDAVSVALKDPAVFVRKQTLTLLTRLLKENFLKFKGQVLYRFLAALLDPAEEIRQLAEISIVNALLMQNPELMQAHFMECVFYFNGLPPNRLNPEAEIGLEPSLCPLRGPAKRPQRLTLYRFMLKHSLVEGKWKAFVKLNADILKAVTEETLDLGSPAILELLEDALIILQMAELEIATGGGKKDEEDVDAEAAGPVAAKNKAAATRAAVTRAVIEAGLVQQMSTVIPTVVSLKSMLQARRSPLQKRALDYLMFLLRKHPNEVNDFLATQKRLKAEIDYELEREARAKERQAQREAKEAARLARRKDRLQQATDARLSAGGAASATPSRQGFSTPPVASAAGATGDGSPKATPATPEAVTASRRKSTQLLRQALVNSAVRGRGTPLAGTPAAALPGSARAAGEAAVAEVAEVEEEAEATQPTQDDDDDDDPIGDAEAAACLSPAVRRALGIRNQEEEAGPTAAKAKAQGKREQMDALAEALEREVALEKEQRTARTGKENEEEEDEEVEMVGTSASETSVMGGGRMVSTPNRTLAQGEVTFQLNQSPISALHASPSQPAYKKARTLQRNRSRKPSLPKLKE